MTYNLLQVSLTGGGEEIEAADAAGEETVSKFLNFIEQPTLFGLTTRAAGKKSGRHDIAWIPNAG
jgi:hypothetical protein